MVVDIVVSVILIASVLLQSGKSSGFAGLGGGESMFSGKPTDMDEALSRITAVSYTHLRIHAVLFGCTARLRQIKGL